MTTPLLTMFGQTTIGNYLPMVGFINKKGNKLGRKRKYKQQQK